VIPIHADPDVDRFWTAAREHSRPDCRAGAAVAYLNRTGQAVTASRLEEIAEVSSDVAEEFAGWYAAGPHVYPGRVHAIAVGLEAAYHLTTYAVGPAHPRRRRRSS
jgi:hypothetical protein